MERLAGASFLPPSSGAATNVQPNGGRGQAAFANSSASVNDRVFSTPTGLNLGLADIPAGEDQKPVGGLRPLLLPARTATSGTGDAGYRFGPRRAIAGPLSDVTGRTGGKVGVVGW